MTLSEKLYDSLIGQQVGFGQCGSLTSDFFQYQTGYNFADSVSNPAPRISSAPSNGYFATAWDVYTQVDWDGVGYEYINKPRKDQLRADDTFFVSPRPNLPTGHTGIIASIINGNVTTFEQNVNGALYVQKLAGENSLSWYGFDGIVRKKSAPKPQPTQVKGDLTMFIQEGQKQYIISSTGRNYIESAEQSKTLTRFYGKPKVVGKDINKREVDLIEEALTGGKK